MSSPRSLPQILVQLEIIALELSLHQHTQPLMDFPEREPGEPFAEDPTLPSARSNVERAAVGIRNKLGLPTATQDHPRGDPVTTTGDRNAPERKAGLNGRRVAPVQSSEQAKSDSQDLAPLERGGPVHHAGDAAVLVRIPQVGCPRCTWTPTDLFSSTPTPATVEPRLPEHGWKPGLVMTAKELDWLRRFFAAEMAGEPYPPRPDGSSYETCPQCGGAGTRSLTHVEMMRALESHGFEVVDG